MKIKYFIFISSIIILSCIDADFDVKYKLPLENNNIINYFSNIFLEVDISFGSNQQKFKCELDIGDHLLVVASTKAEEDIQKFNSSSSDTFVKVRDVVYSYFERFYDGVIGEDTIKLGESEKIDNIQFAVADSFLLDPNLGCYIGLSMDINQVDFKGYNLLEQLKKNNKTERQTWYLDFKEYNKGKFVIGKYPYEIGGEKPNYNNIYNISMRNSYGYNYGIDFDEVSYGNMKDYDKRHKMETHKTAAISLSYRYIICTYEFGEYIQKEFFSKKVEDKVCFHDYINQRYNYYYCDKKKINLSEMQNLYFTLRNINLTFVLEPKDLFYENNGYLYYLIIYKNYFEDDSDKDYEWKFGIDFLKKYTLTFNRDDKVITYYKTHQDEVKDDDKPESTTSNTKYIVIIIVLSVVFIFCIAFLVFYIIKIKPRKKKANELEEDYDYQAKDNKFSDPINA
jgi:hypothetical protein